MKRCLFPLASSAGWFERAALAAELDRRLKVAVLLHDEVHVENGSYRFSVADSGVVEQPMAPSAMTWDRTAAGFLTGQHALPPGLRSSLAVDFMPLLAHAGLLERVVWQEQSLQPPVRRALRGEAEKLAREQAVVAATPYVLPAERDALVKTWLFDAFAARNLRATVALDARAAPFVDKVNRAVEALVQPVVKAPLRRVAFIFALPDADTLLWPDVLALRDSDAGRWLRDAVRSLAERTLANNQGTDVVVNVAPDEQKLIDDATARNPDDTAVMRVIFALNYAALAGFEQLGLADTGRSATSARDWTMLVGRVSR